MHKLPEVELAYIAGFFDGDGSISAECVNQRWYPSVSMSQKDPMILLWIQGFFGGRIDVVGGVGYGDSHSLALRKEERIQFLRAVLPYLKIKRKRAELALQLDERQSFQGNFVPDEERETRKRIAAEIRAIHG